MEHYKSNQEMLRVRKQKRANGGQLPELTDFPPLYAPKNKKTAQPEPQKAKSTKKADVAKEKKG